MRNSPVNKEQALYYQLQDDLMSIKVASLVGQEAFIDNLKIMQLHIKNYLGN